MNKKNLLSVLMIAFFLTACDVPPPVKEALTDAEKAVVELFKKVNELLGISEHKVPEDMKKEMKHANDAEAPKNASELAKENLELLSEMMRVIFDNEKIDDKSDFGSLAHSLNQGASLEGIYRGIVMGARYQGLEGQSQAASPATIKAFAIEMAEVQVDMRNPTVFHDGESRKPVEIVYPDENAAANTPPESQPDQQAPSTKRPKEQIALGLVRIFVGASPFTLKRILGEESLKRIDEFQDANGQMNITDLAQWYAAHAVRMGEKNVDFGLADRNKADYDFHFKWAQHMAPDRVKWEVLNRDHRYINSVSKQK